jgi:hypothetical protein
MTDEAPVVRTPGRRPLSRRGADRLRHTAVSDTPRVAYFATQGSDSLDHARIQALLEPLGANPLPFDRTSKARAFGLLVWRIARDRPNLVVMEGTGIAGGAALILCRLFGRRYVVSSGDAVGPYVRLVSRSLAPVAGIYERLLCRFSAGFIGWSPYLVGRALTMGAPRAMTAPGWAPDKEPSRSRSEVRAALGIPENALVFGLVGSLAWSKRAGYCYGLELVRALRAVRRADVRVVIVGDGDGRARLEAEAGRELGRRVLLTGAVPHDDVSSYLEAFDVASLPQSVDGVGSFRYTTKIPEYLKAGLPVVTGEIPLAYDLDVGWLWRLPGDAPWAPRYTAALTALMEGLSADELEARRARVPRDGELFSKTAQQRRVRSFVLDLLEPARKPDERAAVE